VNRRALWSIRTASLRDIAGDQRRRQVDEPTGEELKNGARDGATEEWMKMMCAPDWTGRSEGWSVAGESWEEGGRAGQMGPATRPRNNTGGTGRPGAVAGGNAPSLMRARICARRAEREPVPVACACAALRLCADPQKNNIVAVAVVVAVVIAIAVAVAMLLRMPARAAATACPLCPLSLPLPSSSPFVHQQSRLYAQVQRNRTRHTRDAPRPSRMVLSDTVSTAPKPRRSSREPFAHLNKTKPPSVDHHHHHHHPSSRSSHSGRRHDARRTNQEPFHALKMQKSLHEIPYGSRSAIKKKIQQIDAFEQLPLADVVQQAVKDALPDLEYRQPTPAQAVAIPALLGHQPKRRTRNPSSKPTMPVLESFLLAAETGSGKTLAYLLPTIDAIKREEIEDKEEIERKQADAAAARALEQRNAMFSVEPPELNKAIDPARPRAVILVPSAELVAQVGTVAKSLSHRVKFRAAPVSAKNSATVIRNRLFNENGVDLIISTPPLLSSIVESNPNILARVTHLIIDEADSLLDRSFKPSTTEILEKAMPSLKKLMLCSATIPKYLDKYLADKFPDMQRLVTPNLHAIPRRVQLGVIDVNKDPYRGNKMLACADTIWQIGKAVAEYDPAEGKEAMPTKRILVFVNEREDTDKVAQYLIKKGIDAMAFHRDTDPMRQAKALSSFTGTAKPKTDKAEAEKEGGKAQDSDKRQLANTKVIVTTDLGSRGIDTVSVRHVILYDVPHTTIDFIHRLGRTGRMGRRGRGIVLVGPGDRADVVKEVREAMFRGEALI